MMTYNDKFLNTTPKEKRDELTKQFLKVMGEDKKFILIAGADDFALLCEKMSDKEIADRILYVIKMMDCEKKIK